MVVVPLATSEIETARSSGSGRKVDKNYWVRVADAGSLAASGVLLMAGKRRAGLAVAAAGAALTVLDQQDTVRIWWNHMPEYLTEAQGIINRVQGAVEELSAQGERLRSILSR